MTRASWDKLGRTFEEKDGRAVRREKKLPYRGIAKVGDCRMCGKPVMAGNGQVLQWVDMGDGVHLYSHKKCRKSQRKEGK